MTEKIALMTHFADVNDPRRDQGKRHMLSDILTLTICAVLSGANTWVEIEDYGQSKHDWLKTFLSLPHGIPSHDTLSDVFARLNPAELEVGFQRWVTSIAAAITEAQIHIDGKVLRGSADTASGKKPLHLVSAWVSEVNLILGQVKTDDKSNEITAIPQLLNMLVLEGALVTIDAMGTQTDIAEQIVQRGGDYLLAIKGNHKTMLQDLDDLFAGWDAVGFVDVPHDTAETVNKGHGRLEIRRCQTLTDPRSLDYVRRQTEWKNLRTLVRIQRERRVNERVTTKDFANQLNVVVLIKTHIKSNKRAHVLLFSTDLSLSADQIVDYYSLRFQIEFNFRDAKQYWGLEDFMNVTKQAVTNAVNLSFLMVNLSAILLRPYRAQQPDFSVLDLKTQFRARRYLDETIKSLPHPPTADFISRLWRRFSALGGIRLPSKPPNVA